MKLLDSSPAQTSAGHGLALRAPLVPVATDLAIFLGVFAVLWPTTASLMKLWADTASTAYTHGYLVAATSLWLLWRNRKRAADAPSRPNFAALAALVAMSILWLVAYRASIQIVHEMLLPLMIATALCTVRGAAAAKVQIFAVAYLYFAMPVWGSVNGVFQSLTVFVVDLLLRLTGVVAYVEGNFVHLSSGVFEIADGCSGLHFFVVALAISALYGEVHRDSTRVRLLLLALGSLLALLTNWVRVYTIILAGYLTDMQHYLITVDHYRFGWVVFAVMMAVFFVLARRLPSAAHEDATYTSSSSSHPRNAALLLIALGAAALGPLWQTVAPLKPASLPAIGELVPSAGDWGDAKEVAAGDWAPVFHGADLTWRGEYLRDGSRVEVFVAAYAVQAQGKELVSWNNALFDAATAKRVDATQHRDSMAQLTLEDKHGVRSIVRYQYRVDDFGTASEAMAQIGFGMRSLRGAPVSRVIALRSVCVPDCDAGSRLLDDFVNQWKGEGAPSGAPRHGKFKP